MSLHEQKALYEQIESEGGDVSLGDEYYLIPKRFFVSWAQWLDGKGAQPTEIEAKDLLLDENRLRPKLNEKIDYEIISKKSWDTLSGWYYSDAAIKREVTLTGLANDHKSVEVNPLLLRVEYISNTIDQTHEISIARNLRTSDLKNKICQVLGVKEKDVTINVSLGDSTMTSLDLDEDILLYESELTCHDRIIVKDTDSKDYGDADVADTDKETNKALTESKFPGKGIVLGSAKTYNYVPSSQNSYSSYSTGSSSTYNYKSSYDDYYSSNSSTLSPSTVPGIVGLQNLGNTCFMNSGLQCLSNTPDLRKFFIKDRHLKDINEKNVLGTGGSLAREFATLIKAMWSGGSGSVAPRAFKSVLGRFAPQFMGYQQHDSQELLSFLLDGLHEDLNRVIQKPYVEQVEQTNLSDEETARLSWENHLKRNQSIIVDLFHGQFRSRVECGQCPKISVTYDPFMYLSLHLPNSLTMNVTVRLFRLDGIAKLHHIKISKSATILDLKKAVGKEVNIQARNLAAVDIYRSRIYSVYPDRDELSDHCRATAVIDCFELEEYESDAETLIVHIQHASSKVDYYGSRPSFDYPYVARVKRNEYTKANIESFIRRVYPTHMQAIERANSSEQPFYLMVTGTYASWEKEWVKMEEGKVYSSGHVVCIWAEHMQKDIEDIQQPEESMSSSTSERRSSVSLQECLDLFTTPERLTEDNLWFCPCCKEHKQATKQMELWSLPKILVIQLKRFSYTKYFRDKIDTVVEFPIKGLDLSTLCRSYKPGDPPLIYDLYAVSNHMGGLGGGHYTAYCLNSEDGRWRTYDDSYVSSASADHVVSSSAYVLFYKRRESGDQDDSPMTTSLSVGRYTDETRVSDDDSDEMHDAKATYSARPPVSSQPHSTSKPVRYSSDDDSSD